MYSAPPQYHVRGAAINLILKGYRTGESGLKGEVKAGYLHDYKNGAQGGLNLLYTHPKWNIDLLYNTQYRRHRQKTNTYSRHTLNNKIYDIHQQGIIDNKGMTHHIRVGAEYKTNKEVTSVWPIQVPLLPTKEAIQFLMETLPHLTIAPKLTSKCIIWH